MKELLDGEKPELYSINRDKETKGSEQKEFKLPERADTMKHLFAYLTKTRFLSAGIVQSFVKNKLIYQEKTHNNIVFVGTDTDGTPKMASMKSPNPSYSKFKQTVAGSDTNYCFSFRGKGEKLFVFEAAIDLLSYLTLYPENWWEQNYIALDGLSRKPLLRFLEESKTL